MLDDINNGRVLEGYDNKDIDDDNKRNVDAYDDESDEEAGGFILEEPDEEAGGFILEESNEHSIPAQDDEDVASVGGGFLPESTNSEQYGDATSIQNTNEAKCDPDDSDDMPDEFFTYDESGELVYNPGDINFAAKVNVGSTSSTAKLVEVPDNETAEHTRSQVMGEENDMVNTNEAEHEYNNEDKFETGSKNKTDKKYDNYDHEVHIVDNIQALLSKKRDVDDSATFVRSQSSVSSNDATPTSHFSESAEDEFGFEYDSD
jgi:hypothetical protein